MSFDQETYDMDFTTVIYNGRILSLKLGAKPVLKEIRNLLDKEDVIAHGNGAFEIKAPSKADQMWQEWIVLLDLAPALLCLAPNWMLAKYRKLPREQILECPNLKKELRDKEDITSHIFKVSWSKYVREYHHRGLLSLSTAFPEHAPFSFGHSQQAASRHGLMESNFVPQSAQCNVAHANPITSPNIVPRKTAGAGIANSSGANMLHKSPAMVDGALAVKNTIKAPSAVVRHRSSRPRKALSIAKPVVNYIGQLAARPTILQSPIGQPNNRRPAPPPTLSSYKKSAATSFVPIQGSLLSMQQPLLSSTWTAAAPLLPLPQKSKKVQPPHTRSVEDGRLKQTPNPFAVNPRDAAFSQVFLAYIRKHHPNWILPNQPRGREQKELWSNCTPRSVNIMLCDIPLSIEELMTYFPLHLW
jgi:hypothetical protein